MESDHGSGEAIVAHSESDTSDGDVSQSVDTLDAPTLQLGEQSPTTEKDGSGSDSDSLSGETVASRTPSDQRDSQVSSGWLGKVTWLRMPVLVQRLQRNVATINLILGSGGEI